MAKLNLCVSTNTLKIRVNEFASSVMFRGLAVERYKKATEKLEAAVATAKGIRDTVGGEDYLKKVEAALEEEKSKYKAVLALPEAKFAYDTEADRHLRKDWKKATTDAMRINALRKWFATYGIPCPEGSDAQILELVKALTHLRKNSTKKIVEGGDWAVEANLSMPTLYAIMVDWHFDANLMKSGLIPQELKDIYAERAAQAKARREARKNANKKDKASK